MMAPYRDDALGCRGLHGVGVRVQRHVRQHESRHAHAVPALRRRGLPRSDVYVSRGLLQDFGGVVFSNFFQGIFKLKRKGKRNNERARVRFQLGALP